MTEKAAPALLARTVLQQCLHARLQVAPPGPESEAEWVQVGYLPPLEEYYGADLQLVQKIPKVVQPFSYRE